MFSKLKLTVAILIIHTTVIISQQLPFSNQYLFNRHFLSPAYSGITDNLETFINYQTSTLEFPGGPEYASIFASGPVYGNMSLGGSVSKSSVTIFSGFSAMIDYAYHLKLSESQRLHFGLAFEYIENYIDISNQPSSPQNDPYIPKVGHTFNAGFGLIYSYKTFALGVSIPRMFESTYKSRETDDMVYSLSRIIRMHASYLFDISQSFELEPFIVVDKSAVEPIWYNVSTLLRFKEVTWAEVHYRQGGIMGFCLGASPTKKMIFNYTYEFSGSGIMKYSSGNHEITLGFLIGRIKENKFNRSPFRSLPKQPYYDWIK